MAIGKLLKTSRQDRIPLGLKAERFHHVITNNPSSANPKETLYIRRVSTRSISLLASKLAKPYPLSVSKILGISIFLVIY
jgi:hypothetical protein